MNRRVAFIFLFAFLAAIFSSRVSAQVPPFFAPGAAVLFDPEIAVVESGAVNDVQAVVSSDRKYVTMNMRPTNSSLLALREFAFQSRGPALGFVGGASAIGNTSRQSVNGSSRVKENRTLTTAARSRSRRQPQIKSERAAMPSTRPSSLLDRQGVTRVDAPGRR